MAMDYETLELLRSRHPAWRLLCAQHAPLIASFLHRAFIAGNVRYMSQADLSEALEDTLYALREQNGADSYRGSAIGYLNEWAENDKGWLRKFYQTDSDEPCFDLTPAAEKALSWLESLTERTFIGTESRLLTIFDLLKQMSEGSETDPQLRINELQKRRDSIDAEISQILAGDIPLLDETAIKDRFQQFMQMARDLLTDFREVEDNFRLLDRKVREKIASWDGSKGELLAEILGERDTIADSDQGRSFRAFWDFLMSSSRQDEFSRQIEHVLSLDPVREMQPDARVQRIHYDWLEAGEHTQRTVAKLSQRLRHFLDDQAWLEDQRIMRLLRNIENRALALRDELPQGNIISLPEIAATINLPLERPLFNPPVKPVITDTMLETGEADVDTAILYSQIMIDRTQLIRHIRGALHNTDQINLSEITQLHPLRYGLAELVTYLQMAGTAAANNLAAIVDESVHEEIMWETEEGHIRKATLPRVIFLRAENMKSGRSGDKQNA